MVWKAIIVFLFSASCFASQTARFDEQYFSGKPQSSGAVITNYVENGTNFTAHIFSTVGTNYFLSHSPRSCEVLVVAGGGSAYGDKMGCGGAGAGGILYHPTNLVSGLTLVVVGRGATNYSEKGQDSYFGLLKAFGGGSTVGKTDDASGGSGSGRGHTLGFNAGGTSTQTSNNGGTGYGNAGGNSVYAAPYWMGSGGGAGAAGSNNGNGGIGTQFSLSGTNVYYAGGGGQQNNDGTVKNGGLGGGGTQGDGVAGSGGGAGGARVLTGFVSYSGGSGIVIVRYKNQ